MPAGATNQTQGVRNGRRALGALHAQDHDADADRDEGEQRADGDEIGQNVEREDAPRERPRTRR